MQSWSSVRAMFLLSSIPIFMPQWVLQWSQVQKGNLGWYFYGRLLGWIRVSQRAGALRYHVIVQNLFISFKLTITKNNLSGICELFLFFGQFSARSPSVTWAETLIRAQHDRALLYLSSSVDLLLLLFEKGEEKFLLLLKLDSLN